MCLLLLTWLIGSWWVVCAQLPPFDINNRISQLLATMTLQEKARQLDMYAGGDFVVNGELDFDVLTAELGSLGAGVIHDFYPPTADISNTVQEYVVSTSGIPVLFLEECLHGYQQGGHTIFPSPISMGSTWNPALLHQVGRAVASEARSYGVCQCLAPVLGVGREPRWGRIEETYGEDTFLNARYAAAVVSGLQGSSDGSGLWLNSSVISEPKHFCAHSIPEGGQNTAAAHLGRRELEEVFLPVFAAAVEEGGARGIMAAYSEIDGIPNAANHFTLTQLLRDTWGFKGYVLSDLGAISMLNQVHQVAHSPNDAIRQYLEAGGNMQFYDFPHALFQGAIVNMTKAGILSEAVLNSRVADVLRVKFELGLFNNPYTDPSLVGVVVNSVAHQLLSLQVAQQCIVLLKNDAISVPRLRKFKSLELAVAEGLSAEERALEAAAPILPLDMQQVGTVAVIGPSSDEPQFGDYTAGFPGLQNVNNANIVTLWQGLKDYVAMNNVSVKLVNSWGTGILSNTELYSIHRGHFVNLQGTYYNNTALSGSPAFVRADAEINFQWYHYGPIQADQPVYPPYSPPLVARQEEEQDSGRRGRGAGWIPASPQPSSGVDQIRVRRHAAAVSEAQAHIPADIPALQFAAATEEGKGEEGDMPRRPHAHHSPTGGGGGGGGIILPGTCSVHWSGQIVSDVSVSTGLFGFTAGDGGARLTVNGQVILSNWNNPGHDPAPVPFAFVAGQPLTFQFDYFRVGNSQSQNPQVELQWSLFGSDGNGIARAAQIAAAADVAIVAVGDSPNTVGEGMDRHDLMLLGDQLQLVQAVVATGTPVVVVLLNGRPPAVGWIRANVAAIIEAWQPGQAQGAALAQVLFGAVNPAGRISVSIPRDAGQLPVFYNYKPSSRRVGYIDGGIKQGEPLWHFGHGLSYTSFNYSQLAITPARVALSYKATVTVTCVVKNTGSVDGEEVPQLYIRDVVSSTTTPVKSLRGFHRMLIKSGQSTRVTFVIDVMKHLKLFNRDFQWVVEPGQFNVMVGPSSDNIALHGSFEVMPQSPSAAGPQQ